MKPHLYFFSNVTLGYGSPKYIYFLEECQRLGFSSMQTIEPLEGLRPYYDIPQLPFSRLVIGKKFYDFIRIDKLRKSFRVNKYFLAPLFSTLAAIKVLRVAARSYYSPVFVVTTYESALFGLLSGKTLICQNYSEIWEEKSEGTSKVGLLSNISQALKKQYYQNVDILIAPQKDRLKIAGNRYSHAKRYLVHNCPKLAPSVEYDKDTDKKRLLYQGRISKDALGDSIIRLAECLSDDIEFHIAGIVNREYLGPVEELQSRGTVVFHGYLKWGELESIRKKCNIGLVSWSELTLNTKYCAPNKLYEYIAEGMYVVGFPNYSLESLVTDFNVGKIRPDGDSLAKFLDELAAEELEEQGRRNIELYKSLLNFDHQIKDVISHIENSIKLIR